MDLLSQHEAFLRAIFDTPVDDAARLVYADFLQENDEEIRAELIRVQCELGVKAGRAEYFDRLLQLATREGELIVRLTPKWEELDRYTCEYLRSKFNRGFLQSTQPLLITSETLSDPDAERWRIVRETPELFDTENLHVIPGLLLRPEHIELLFSLPVTHRITQWILGGLVEDELTVGDPDTFNLTEIVQTPAITTAGVETLARQRGARRITLLDLRNNNLDNDAARALVNSPYLDNLQSLQLLEGNRFRGKVWQQVIERFGEDVVG